MAKAMQSDVKPGVPCDFRTGHDQRHHSVSDAYMDSVHSSVLADKFPQPDWK